MSALSTQQQTPSEILLPIFTAKITRKGVDQEALLDEYLFVLKGMPRQAVVSVVHKIRTGQLAAETDYCPLPPELANMVREEWRLQRVLNDPKPHISSSTLSAFDKARKRWYGVKPIATGITLDTWANGGKTGRWPFGAIFSAILGNVYQGHPDDTGPNPKKDIAARVMENFHAQNKKDRDAFSCEVRDMTDQEKEYWQKISFMPDAKKN